MEMSVHISKLDILVVSGASFDVEQTAVSEMECQ